MLFQSLLGGVLWGIVCSCSVFTPKESIASQACGRELAQRLSSGAKIYCPGSEAFDNSTKRWSTFDAPTFRMTVEVATQNDVAEVVKYANRYDLPFLAVNGAHGAQSTVGGVRNGIMIWMRQLNSVKVAADGQTATFGGGILDKAVTDGLWAAGKQTVTGGCECVSLIGPGLGGGHGFLQARHGLVSDQFVSLQMVLADGTLQTIDRNHELWWAVRGAGHNFGIVTSITSTIYDVKFPKWAFQSFVFTGDKVEALYTNINERLLRNGTQPVDIFSYSVFLKNPTVDTENPIISFYILQEGVGTVDEALTAPFLALKPASSSSGSGEYPDVPKWIGWGNDAGTCQKLGRASMRFPLDLQTYDVPAQRRVYDLFSSTLKETPALNGSAFLFEGYSVQGIKAKPSKDSAYAFRESNLLVAPIIRFQEAGEELETKAESLGQKLRNILHEASGQRLKRTYVNYSFGTESLANLYGDERWRQERLLALKKKYDPRGKFSFYAPIM